MPADAANLGARSPPSGPGSRKTVPAYTVPAEIVPSGMESRSGGGPSACAKVKAHAPRCGGDRIDEQYFRCSSPPPAMGTDDANSLKARGVRQKSRRPVATLRPRHFRPVAALEGGLTDPNLRHESWEKQPRFLAQEFFHLPHRNRMNSPSVPIASQAKRSPPEK